MLKYGILILSILLSFSPAFAQYPQPDLEAYGALPMVSDAELSPDGTRVATISNTDDGSYMLVLDIEDGEIVTGAQIGDIKARSVGYFDNSHIILKVSDTISTRGFRGEYEYGAAFSMNLETKKLEQLLYRTDGLFPAQSGIGTIVGRGNRTGEVLMPAFFGQAHAKPSYDLFRAKLGSNKGKRHTRGTGDTRDWFVDAQGNVLARVRYNNKSNKFLIQKRTGKTWVNIYEEKRDRPFSIFGVTLDESGLVFSRVEADKAGYTELMKLNFDGTIDGPIIPVRDREIESIMTDKNRKVVGVRYAGVSPEYEFLDRQLQESFEATSDALPHATIYVDSWSDDRSVVLYQVFEPSLGDVWLIHKPLTNELAIVTDRRPDIPSGAIATMMDITYQARDGLAIQAILTVPPDYDQDAYGPMPAILMPHGGPAAYDGFDFDWMAQYFANRGYLVLQPNFRGSEGFGQAFEDAGRGEWGAKMQHDLTDGLNALVTAGFVDAERVCIAGASYGGYAALAVAVFTPDLYKCVIAIAPVSDLNRMLRDEKRERGRHHWVVSYWEDIMANGDARREKLRSISPVNFADEVIAPVLLLHGDDDTVVPYDQSRVMERALRRADKHVELIKLKGEDHWLSVADTRLQTLRQMDRFIAEHLPLE